MEADVVLRGLRQAVGVVEGDEGRLGVFGVGLAAGVLKTIGDVFAPRRARLRLGQHERSRQTWRNHDAGYYVYRL